MAPVNRISRNLLVLDLDETLIHSSETALDRIADTRLQHFHVYKRPYLAEFLSACAEWYEIGVWSSASDDYVGWIVDEIFPRPDALHFVWGSGKTTIRRSLPNDYDRYGTTIGEYHYRKPLSKLKRFGWPVERMLIVDDSPEKCATNFGNAIYPAPYTGQRDDDELRYLASYLLQLKDHQDYRTFEKRGWRRLVDPIDW